MVAKRRRESNSVTGSVWSRARGGQQPAGLAAGSLESSEQLEGEHWHLAGEEIVAGVTIRPQLSCYRQSAASWTMLVPSLGDGGWAA